MKSMNYRDLNSNVFNKDMPLCSLEMLSKEEQVEGFTYLARQVMKGSKPNLKPCDDIPERVFVYTKSHIKKIFKLRSGSDIGLMFSVFNFTGNAELTLFLSSIFHRTMKIVSEKYKIHPRSISTMFLQSNSVTTVNFANNMKPPVTIDLLSINSSELNNLIKKSYQQLIEFEVNDPSSKCLKCIDKCEMFKGASLSVVPDKKKPSQLLVEKPNVRETLKVVPKSMSVSDLVKASIEQIKGQSNKTLQATHLLQLILTHNNGCVPSFPDFIQESKNLGIQEIAYKYQKLFKRSNDFDLTTNKFSGDYSSVDFLRKWYVTERNKSEEDYVKPHKRLNKTTEAVNCNLEVPTAKAFISNQDEIKDFIREVEKRMKKIEIEYLELQSFIYKTKKHLDRSESNGTL